MQFDRWLMMTKYSEKTSKRPPTSNKNLKKNKTTILSNYIFQKKIKTYCESSKEKPRLTVLLLSDVGLLGLDGCLSSTLNTLTMLSNTLLNIVDLFKIMWLFSRLVQQSSLRPTEIIEFMSKSTLLFCSHALTAKEWTCAVRNSALFLYLSRARKKKKAVGVGPNSRWRSGNLTFPIFWN